MQTILRSMVLFSLALTLLVFGCKNSGTDPQEDGIKVLVVSNFPEMNAWIDTNFTANMEGVQIIVLDVEQDTVDTEDLQGINVVLLFEDGIFSQSTLVGNLLYQYVMSGGNLVIGTFYWQDHTGSGFGGSWGDLEMIHPLFRGSCDYRTESLGTTLNHPLTAGLTSLKTYYRGGPDSLRNNATAVAWWSDGDVLIAFNKPGGTITMVTTHPAENWWYEFRGSPDPVEGDFFKLWENALKWTAAQGNSAAQSKPVEAFKHNANLSPTEVRTQKPSGGGRDY